MNIDQSNNAKSMVCRESFAMVQLNQSLCTRPCFGLGFTAKTWFLGTTEQPTFAAFIN